MTHKHTVIGGLAAIALVAALTACNSATDSVAHRTSTPRQSTSSAAIARAASAPDPCRLVTADEIAMLTHTTVVSHRLANDVDLRRCTWTLRSSEVGTIADPSVEVEDAVNKDLGPLDTFGDLTRGYTAMSGIGEKASTGRASGADQLVVVKHGIVVAVTAQVYGNDHDDPANESIARFAVVGL